MCVVFYGDQNLGWGMVNGERFPFDLHAIVIVNLSRRCAT